MYFISTIILIIIAFTMLLFYWIHWKWRHRRLLELAEKLPGPPALPIIGNALIFMAKSEGKYLFYFTVILKFRLI